MTTVTYPRSQHWTVDGFRVSVLLYKTSTDPCVTCGQKPAQHAVWADGRGDREGFRGGAVHFCDEHRPAKGTLPPLEYVRVLAGSLAGTAWERIGPYPGAGCGACGAPPVLRYVSRCAGCDDPAFQYSTRQILPASGGIWAEDEPVYHHRPHDVAEQFRCTAHPLLAGGA